jgi:hypothetical protein
MSFAIRDARGALDSPHGRDQNQRRTNARLEHAQQEPRRHQRSVRITSRCTSHDSAPTTNHRPEILCSRKTLLQFFKSAPCTHITSHPLHIPLHISSIITTHHHISMRHLKCQKRHIKDQRQRPILLGSQIRIFQQSHDRSVVQKALV